MNRRSFIRMGLFSFLSAAFLFFSGCSSSGLADHQAATPALHLAEFFNGRLVAHGMVQDRSGAVTRRFRADLVGTWQPYEGGFKGILDEQFYWDDGEQSERIWSLTATADGRYFGTAADVVGQAQGQANGSVLQWQYRLQLPPEQGGWQLDFDDTLVLIDEQQLLNVAIMRKWGIEVGRVTLQIRKLD